MIEYYNKASDKLLTALIEHAQLTGIAFFWALVFATLITTLLIYFPKLLNASVYVLSLPYAIPSFALFSLLIPMTGLGPTTAIVALVIYAQYTLVRSFISGLTQVDKSVIEAAIGMGMTKGQVLRKVQIPLAITAIFAGLRLTANSLIAIATIASTVNAGGLGKILFDGLRTMSLPKLAWGIILTVGLSLFVNLMFLLLEELLKPKQLK